MSAINKTQISEEEFFKYFESIKNWASMEREFPHSIERGSLNYITAEKVVFASQLIHEGVIVPTALEWNTVAGPDNHKPALHYMSELGTPDDPQPACNKDFIGVDYHGKAVSHLDAMTHIAYRNQLYGGKTSTSVVGSTGSQWATVDKLGPIVTRGVLLDAALFNGVEWLEPGTAVHASDVLEMEKKFNFTLEAGDCVLLRSGHFARRDKLGVWDPSDFSAGFHYDVMELFKERKVSVIGADGDSDLRPSPVENLHSPIHILALPGLGIPLLDNLQLEALAQACNKRSRWTFQFSILPLNIPHATGSPVNPIAIF